MKLKVLGTFILGVILIAGCQKGSKNEEAKNQKSESQQQATGQQMPGQMQQAQDIEVSDKEVKKFVEAAKKIQVLNQKIQQDMNKAISNEGMETQRFNEIHRSQQSQQQQQSNVNASDKEMQQYNAILKELQNVQSGAQQDMKKAVEEAGLSMQRYQQIAIGARQDSTLMNRIQKEMQSSMQMQ